MVVVTRRGRIRERLKERSDGGGVSLATSLMVGCVRVSLKGGATGWVTSSRMTPFVVLSPASRPVTGGSAGERIGSCPEATRRETR